MKTQSAAQPLSPAAVRLFGALSPDAQYQTLSLMLLVWHMGHPSSRRFRRVDLLVTREQRKAHVEFQRGVERSKRERRAERAVKGGA